jgi:glycosyltransferase involved in cell wall biosynthesis
LNQKTGYEIIMSRNVLYFSWQPLHQQPPCVTQILTLKDMGITVSVLTKECSTQVGEALRKRGVPVELITPVVRHNKLLQKAENYLNYRACFQNFFRKYWTNDSILWIGTEQGAIRMWPFLRKHHPIVLNALEFYETEWYQKGMKRIAPQVDVLTACEPHRAQYMVDWWKLRRKPWVLPNKPYDHPRQTNLPGSTPELQQAIDRIQGKRTILYQGGIFPDRSLVPLAEALKQMNGEYYLVIAGAKDPRDPDAVEKLQAIYDKTIYVGYLPSPLHLELTSHAAFGVAFYQDDCINNRYCAPNKIYEYAGFGIPMLCNTLPGLTESVGKAGAAECVDFHDPDAVIGAIKKMEQHYEEYSHAATAFYEATDIVRLITDVVEDAFSGTEAEKL